jgi:photosystem II stability/assembly factor-like uncharacterized protein
MKRLSALMLGLATVPIVNFLSPGCGEGGRSDGMDAGQSLADVGARGGSSGLGGMAGRSSVGGSSATGGRTGGTSGSGGATMDAGPLPPDPCIAAGTCPVGVWVNVTPTAMPRTDEYGPGSVVRDPARPTDLYVGGSDSGLWKSTDYGNTWKNIATTDDVPEAPRGVVFAVAGTTPATIWAAGYNEITKSTDGGATFKRTPLKVSLYSLQVDSNDPAHLVSGLHEDDGVYESQDGGTTWTSASGDGFPPGGVSWYPFFIDTGNPGTSRTTWFAIPQGGASAVMTSDSGAHWHIPTGLAGLNHPHGNAQIFQAGNTLFVGGLEGPGQGVYRSTDLGTSWSRVDSGQKPQAVVWGSKTKVYAMYGWACGSCDIDPNWEFAPLPGTTWTYATVPAAMTAGSGPNSVVVTNDGNHEIFVAAMWNTGIWRYVEP